MKQHRLSGAESPAGTFDDSNQPHLDFRLACFLSPIHYPYRRFLNESFAFAARCIILSLVSPVLLRSFERLSCN